MSDVVVAGDCARCVLDALVRLNGEALCDEHARVELHAIQQRAHGHALTIRLQSRHVLDVVVHDAAPATDLDAQRARNAGGEHGLGRCARRFCKHDAVVVLERDQLCAEHFDDALRTIANVVHGYGAAGA